MSVEFNDVYAVLCVHVRLCACVGVHITNAHLMTEEEGGGGGQIGGRNEDEEENCKK